MGGKHGPGSGSSLPTELLVLAGVCTVVAVGVSAASIFMHLKSYRKPVLQRMVVRIMLMVPLYAIASFISLFSLEAAFFIDAVRDIYEAFVIYCFFELLLAYLGGERALLILVHGRPPKDAVFPATLFRREIDVSDPYTFRFLKRGILQYVQLKPILAIATMILKVAGVYNEGVFRGDSGYLYISIVYNFSIFLALYCLAVFWMCVNDDLKPFRPTPKFLCVKGILFFSFWQAIAISIFVAAGLIKKLGPYTDHEHISLGLTDLLICIEMPLFAFAHNYAFSYTDFIDPHITWVARMPILYAVRDSFGLRDVIEDSKATLKGEGIDYREFEPAEGYIHQGVGRERRIRAGLRYSQGGKKKYWLPKTTTEAENFAPSLPESVDRFAHRAAQRMAPTWEEDDIYAPLLEDDAERVVTLAPDLQSPEQQEEDDHLVPGAKALTEIDRDEYLLPFGDIDEADEALFEHARRYLFGDYNYPVIDASSERARAEVWDEEERILTDARAAYFSPYRNGAILPKTPQRGYGATGNSGGARERVESNASATSASKGKGRREVVINKEDDRTESMDSNGVRMKWAKTPARSSPLPPSGSPRPGTSAVQSPRSNSMSRTSSSRSGEAPPTPREENRRPVLPPDAVDLVVEDTEEQERVREEHRKGEPQAREFRKVYRRGYVVEGPDGEEHEVEVEDRRDDHDQPTTSSSPKSPTGVLTPENEEEIPPVQELEEAPAHARMLDRLPTDDNPWA